MTQTKTQTHLNKFLLVVASAMVLFACKKDNTPAPIKAPVISYNQKIVSVNVGQSIPTLTPDSSKGGHITQYSVYPGLPKGISLNQSNGVITGTPTDSLNPTRFVVSAYGPGGMGHDTITLAVGTVGFVYGTTGSYVFTRGAKDLATTPLAPTVLAGNFKKFYIDPNTSPNDLLTTTGLSFDQATGKISGTPTKLTSTNETPAALTFIITAITQDNKAAYDTIHITVNDVAPSVSYAFRGSLAVGTSLGSFLSPTVTLQQVTNYGAIVKYRLAPGSPALPDSIVLDSTFGKLTGIPKSSAVGTTNIVVRAINTGGYEDITVPLVVNSTAPAPQIKYLMSYANGDLVDTLCPAIFSGNTIYLTKKDTNRNANQAAVPNIFLNPVLVSGQSGTSRITPSTGSPITFTASTALFSGIPAVTATTPFAATVAISNLQPGNLDSGYFSINMVSNVQYFTYNSGGAGSVLWNIYQFVKGQPVDQAVVGGKYPGYTTAQLAPVTNGVVNKFTIYPMASNVPAFASTGLTFNPTTGAISGTPTLDSSNGTSITASWKYLVVGAQPDGSFTIYQITIKLYSTDGGWAGQ